MCYPSNKRKEPRKEPKNIVFECVTESEVKIAVSTREYIELHYVFYNKKSTIETVLKYFIV